MYQKDRIEQAKQILQPYMLRRLKTQVQPWTNLFHIDGFAGSLQLRQPRWFIETQFETLFSGIIPPARKARGMYWSGNAGKPKGAVRKRVRQVPLAYYVPYFSACADWFHYWKIGHEQNIALAFSVSEISTATAVMPTVHWCILDRQRIILCWGEFSIPSRSWTNLRKPCVLRYVVSVSSLI